MGRFDSLLLAAYQALCTDCNPLTGDVAELTATGSLESLPY
jgi:hypothetical protein